MQMIKDYSSYPNPGIYCLFNLHNNKFYIGSSINISKRIYEHFYTLKKGEHCNIHLQRAYKKYTKYFIAFVMEDAEKDILLEREQYWLDRLEASNPLIGYNISPSAIGTSGYKHTDEAKRKMSLSKSGSNHHNYGKELSEATKKRIGDGNRNKVRSEETKQLLRELNLGKTLSDETKRKISESGKNREWTDEQLEHVRSLNAKEVYQLDKEGNLISVWESAAECARQLGFKRQNIYRVCRGERKKYKGFKWSYEYNEAP